MDNREEFEQWVKDTAEKHEYAFMDRILRRNGDDYATTWVDSAWMGWQAARNDAWLLRKQAEAVDEAQERITLSDSVLEMERAAKNYSAELRQQADEAENG